MTMKNTEKTLYIRVDEDTYNLAHTIAKIEGRSVTKQIIQLIKDYSKNADLSLDIKEPVEKNSDELEQNISVEQEESIGLKSLIAKKKLDS